MLSFVVTMVACVAYPVLTVGAGDNSLNQPHFRNSKRLIIKCSNCATVSGVIKRLHEISRGTVVKLAYIRDMSDGAFVVSAQYMFSETQFFEWLDQVRRRGDVEYVEIDARVHHTYKAGVQPKQKAMVQ